MNAPKSESAAPASPVIVHDLWNVEINGLGAGCVVDACANQPGFQAAIQDGLVVWLDNLLAGDKLELATKATELDQLKAEFDKLAESRDTIARTAESLNDNLQSVQAAMLKLRNENAARMEDLTAQANKFAEHAESVNKANLDLIDKQGQQIRQLTESRDYHLTRGDLLTKLVAHLSNGPTEAAVAVFQELQRIEHAKAAASLQAQIDALKPKD